MNEKAPLKQTTKESPIPAEDIFVLQDDVITEVESIDQELQAFWKLIGKQSLLIRKKTKDIVDTMIKFKGNENQKPDHSINGYFIGKNSPPGSGKSTVLLQVVYFARLLGFMVIYIPNGREYVLKKYPKYAMQNFLLDLKKYNKQHLAKIRKELSEQTLLDIINAMKTEDVEKVFVDVIETLKNQSVLF